MGKPGLLAAPSSRGRCGLGEVDSSPGLALVQDLAKLHPLEPHPSAASLSRTLRRAGLACGPLGLAF